MAITSPRRVSFIPLVLLFIFIGDVTPAPVNRNVERLSKKAPLLPLSLWNSNMLPVQLPFDAIITPTPNVPSSKLQPTTSIPSLLHPRDTRTSGSDPPGRSSPELMPVAAVVSAVFAGILMTMVSAFAVWMCAIRHRHPTNHPPFLKNRGGGGGDCGWGYGVQKPELGSEGCERVEVEGVGRGRPELEGGKGGAELEAEVGGRVEVEEGCERWEVEGNGGARELDDECLVRGELEGG